MSDLQILTGTSILISGYVQLRCGIQAFHWQVIVLLAWFSSITHLSCLTFLRNHLYNRPAERVWRLVAMGLMMVMLLVAIVPTGGYNWAGFLYSNSSYLKLLELLEGYPDRAFSAAPSDYAICYLRPSGRKNIGWDLLLSLDDGALAFWTMVISAVSLALAFIHRVVRLHRSLSISVVGRARTICSEKARDVLRWIYTKTGMKTSGLTFKRLFLYRPLLALFLTARALLDFWNSMFIEVRRI
jgi:hypothetical protein